MLRIGSNHPIYSESTTIIVYIKIFVNKKQAVPGFGTVSRWAFSPAIIQQRKPDLDLVRSSGGEIPGYVICATGTDQFHFDRQYHQRMRKRIVYDDVSRISDEMSPVTHRADLSAREFRQSLQCRREEPGNPVSQVQDQALQSAKKSHHPPPAVEVVI